MNLYPLFICCLTSERHVFFRRLKTNFIAGKFSLIHVSQLSVACITMYRILLFRVTLCNND